MIIRHVQILSAVAATAAVMAMAMDTASSQTLQPGTATARFVTPISSRLIVTPTDSQLCRELQGRRCPPVLVYGGAAGPALPTIEPVIKANLPNVRVSFVLQAIANKVVANGGVSGDPDAFVEWSTTSPAASMEHGGPYGYPLPPPGVTWDGDDLYHAVLYDALVLNACDAFPVFPVTHDAVIQQDGADIGAFHGVDNSTLNHTGYYNFSYKARATGEAGKVSDFQFSGKINVTCSGLNALP
jgi:hypothetical protein